MPEITIFPTNNEKIIRDLSIRTFSETFAQSNTEQDLADFIARDYDLAVLKEEIENSNSWFYLVAVDDVPVGYMKLNIDDAQTEPHSTEYLEIQRIYILREYKGLGLGTRLMQTAFDVARSHTKTRIWLGVWEYNNAAQAFYQHFGFKRTGAHDFYVGDDRQTDYIMEASVDLNNK